MTTAAHITNDRSAAEIANALSGRKCWNVACGGSAGSTFQLALGRKALRDRPLKNPTVSAEFRRYEGEVGLIVWCAWRLVDKRGPITSCSDESRRRDKGLRELAGKTIRKVSTEYGWFLRVEFSGGTVLTVFPDHVGPTASFDGNWEVWTPDRMYSIETDLSCLVESRQSRPARKPARAAKWRASARATVGK